MHGDTCVAGRMSHNQLGQGTVPSRTSPEEQPEHLPLTELYA